MVPRGKRQVKALFITVAIIVVSLGMAWWRG
jgi:hypothetical protein